MFEYAEHGAAAAGYPGRALIYRSMRQAITNEAARASSMNTGHGHQLRVGTEVGRERLQAKQAAGVQADLDHGL